jgi:hypothetical protein
MSATKKATCLAPRAVIAACHDCFAAVTPRSPAAGYARLIADGIALLARASQDAPKLVDLCRSKYPGSDQEISTHIPTSAREQARQLKRAKALSLQQIYLGAVLASLIDRGFMSVGLDAASPESGAPPEGRRRAA